MATWRDVRRLVSALPATSERTSASGTASRAVHEKPFAWERPLRKADVEALGEEAPAGPILAIRTADLDLKDVLLASDPKVFYTTPHFDGYPSVLIRLTTISLAQLEDVLGEAWLTRAPKRAATAYMNATGKTSDASLRTQPRPSP